MWQTDISIGTEYNLGINIKNHLDTLRLNYTNAVSGKGEIFSVADENYKKINDLIVDIRKFLLLDFKLKYFKEKIGVEDFKNESLLLLGEMLFFDSNYESDVLCDVLPLQYEYSIDGIFNFKMKEIRENWDYLIDLYKRTFPTNGDMITLSKFIHDSSLINDRKVYLSIKNDNINIFDIKTGEYFENIKLLDEKSNNLFTILNTHASIVYMEKDVKFNIDTNLLSNVISIEFV